MHPEALSAQGRTGAGRGDQVEVPRVEGTDLFVWEGDPRQVPPGYRIDWTDPQGQVHRLIDPYAFPAQLGDFDLHLFGEGRHWHAFVFLAPIRVSWRG